MLLSFIIIVVVEECLIICVNKSTWGFNNKKLKFNYQNLKKNIAYKKKLRVTFAILRSNSKK